MSEELKPCPFCGKKVSCYHEEYGYQVICGNCGTVADYWCSKENAIRHWNTRPAEDAKDKEIERLKAKLAVVEKRVIDNRDALLSVLKVERNYQCSRHKCRRQRGIK